MSFQNVNQHSTDDNKKALQMRVESLRQEQLESEAPMALPPMLVLIGTVIVSAFVGPLALFIPISLGRGPQLLKAFFVAAAAVGLAIASYALGNGSDGSALFSALLLFGGAIFFEIAVYVQAYAGAEDRVRERRAYDRALLEDLEERANAA